MVFLCILILMILFFFNCYFLNLLYNWNCFSISSFKFWLIENWTSWFFYIGCFGSNDPGHRFKKLTHAFFKKKKLYNSLYFLLSYSNFMIYIKSLTLYIRFTWPWLSWFIGLSWPSFILSFLILFWHQNINFYKKYIYSSLVEKHKHRG